MGTEYYVFENEKRVVSYLYFRPREINYIWILNL